MTQCQISHPEGLPTFAAGHGARHIHDRRSVSAGGGHFIECRCMQTKKHADPDAALASWCRMNRPARSARKQPTSAEIDNVVQMPLLLAAVEQQQRRANGRR